MAAGIVFLALTGNVYRLLPRSAVADGEMKAAIAFAGAGSAEDRLAAGGRIPLARSDIAALELVPRLSSAIAERVVRSRDAIARRAKSLPKGEKHRAFTMIYGVGPKTALLLDGAVELE